MFREGETGGESHNASDQIGQQQRKSEKGFLPSAACASHKTKEGRVQQSDEQESEQRRQPPHAAMAERDDGGQQRETNERAAHLVSGLEVQIMGQRVFPQQADPGDGK